MRREGVVYGMPEAERFWAKVDKSGDCWIYTGSKSTNGYGTVRFNGGYGLAHRIAFTLTKGAIPDGLDLDHLCRTRACVNPSHLEPVTRKENARRGAMSLDFTGRCISGRHSIASGEDLRTTSKGRTCAHCYEDSQANRYRDIREAALKLGIPVTHFIRSHGKSARKAREILNG